MSEDKRWQNRVELSLDNRQIFLLFFASAAVLALVFALGVVVGKRSDAVPGKAAPTDPLALLDQMGADSGEETLTFHEALTKTEPPKPDPAASAAAAPAPSPSSDPRPTAAPAPAAPAKPQVSPEPVEKRQRHAAPEPRSIVKALAAAIPGAQAPGTDESDTGSGKKPTHKPTKEPLAKAEKGKKAEAKEGAEGEGTYTLQLSAFQEKREAEAFIQKLRGSGMQPFMTSTTIPGRGVWFRVRLGKYKTWDEALAAKQDFEKKAKLIAYVSKN